MVFICFHTVFFEESWTKLIMEASPYNRETSTRTTNDEDMFFGMENTVRILHLRSPHLELNKICVQAGYNATAQLTRLGKDLHDGLLGYVTLGVNPTASYEFQDPSYYTGKKHH
jgi:hypothetical protein